MTVVLKKLALTVAGFAAGGAVTLAAVGSAASPASAQMSDQAYLVAQKAQVAATTYQLDEAGLHDVEEASKAGSIPAGALGPVRRARIAVQVAEWPEPLKAMAMEQVDHMKMLEEAIRSEDPAKVVDPATASHNHGHDLSAAVYTWLETGKAPEGGHGH
jgi:hypothetical protein